MIQKYEVVEGESIEDVVREVNHKLQDGWRIAGGIALGRNGHHYQQAISFEEKKPVKDYVLVSGTDPESLQKEVNSMLAQGWRLHDGPTSYVETSSTPLGSVPINRITQAMVKY